MSTGVAVGHRHVCPHDNLPQFELSAKALRASRLPELQPGQRVYWDAAQGINPRRVWLY
jgi:hypothetical protein